MVLKMAHFRKSTGPRWVKVPIDFGLDWSWSSVSFSISNLCFFTKLCVSYSFASVCIYLVRPSPVIAPHSTGHRTYICGFFYARGKGPTVDRETVYFYILVWPAMWPSELNEPSTRRLALDFTSSYRFSPNYTHLTCRNFICQQSAITETTVK